LLTVWRRLLLQDFCNNRAAIFRINPNFSALHGLIRDERAAHSNSADNVDPQPIFQVLRRDLRDHSLLGGILRAYHNRRRWVLTRGEKECENG
jgi:hypothetical protein